MAAVIPPLQQKWSETRAGGSGLADPSVDTHKTPMPIAMATPIFSLNFIWRLRMRIVGMKAKTKSRKAE